MTYDPQRHHRRSIRLDGFDYTTPGPYFLTICTHHRKPILDDPENRSIVAYAWEDLRNKFRHVDLDAFTIMPDHIHGIVILGELQRPVGAGVRLGDPPASRSESTPAQVRQAANRHGLPAVVRQFKNRSARRINGRLGLSEAVWQRTTGNISCVVTGHSTISVITSSITRSVVISTMRLKRRRPRAKRPCGHG